MSQSIEAVRAKFRPERVLTLFVGESAPASAKLFHGDENRFARHVQRAMGVSVNEQIFDQM